MKCLYLQFCKLFSIVKTSGLGGGNLPYITIRKDVFSFADSRGTHMKFHADS